jgi:hypothetical protein
LFNCTSTKIYKNSSFLMFHMRKIQETKCFTYLAPFRPFLGKFGQNSAPDLYSRLHFYSALLSFEAEESANWKHCSSSLPPYPPSNIPENYPVVIFCFYISTKTTLKEKNAKSPTCPHHLPLSSKLFSRHINFTMKRAHAMLRAATQIISRKAARSFIYPRGHESFRETRTSVFYGYLCVNRAIRGNFYNARDAKK